MVLQTLYQVRLTPEGEIVYMLSHQLGPYLSSVIRFGLLTSLEDNKTAYFTVRRCLATVVLPTRSSRIASLVWTEQPRRRAVDHVSEQHKTSAVSSVLTANLRANVPVVASVRVSLDHDDIVVVAILIPGCPLVGIATAASDLLRISLVKFDIALALFVDAALPHAQVFPVSH